MKSLAVATVLFSVAALAFPQLNHKRFTNGTNPNPGPVCTPAKYQCRQNAHKTWGWDVCDTSSRWVNGGNCKTSETCVFNSLNGSPYCVPTPSTAPAPDSGKECNPGKYRCKNDPARGWSIETCSAGGAWEHTLDCAASETCTYGAVAGYPYCTAKDGGRVCSPGTYQCSFNQSWGWDVCSTEGVWVRGGSCKAGETCSFNALNGSPYCV
ncbi:hypothetical protein CPLU01_13958 [Colletotrichum plurivorum]|uniref:Uncharacterized protein n=1 Tax=Colletotrichum plurivorum TaxID=2175906 RepID=A0A8H6JMQ3_9PEZI|nr:hypothetical protein CPLU01_13958 [Colletotrichum plurivorum]